MNNNNNWKFLFLFFFIFSLMGCGSDDDNTVKGISLDKSSMELKINTTDTLYATIQPSNAANQNIIWSTDRSDVLWLDSRLSNKCIIRARKVGTAIVSAKSEDGDFIKECSVSVYSLVERFSLKEKNVFMEKGDQKKFTCVVYPTDARNARLTWNSSSSEVASVDENGNVTALSGGTAVISVTNSDGQYSDKCDVTVNVSLKGIKLDKEELCMVEGERAKLLASLIPEDTTYPGFYWSIDNKDVVSIDDEGNVIALKPGVATITAITNTSRFTASCSIIVESAENIDYNPYGDGQKW